MGKMFDKRIFLTALAILGFATCISPVLAATAKPATWRQDSSSETCSISYNSPTQFLFLAARPDGSHILRLHASDWHFSNEGNASILIGSDLPSHAIQASFSARTTNGWEGVYLETDSSIVDRLRATDSLFVLVDGEKVEEFPLGQFSSQADEFQRCSAALPQRDAAEIPVSAPSLISKLGTLITGIQPPERTFRFRLKVDAEGSVSDCIVIETSGSAKLDKNYCRGLSRARFRPAVNRAGQPVSGQYQSSIGAQ
ncbi:hypothetical protein SZ64_12780 [Erythrobacter sp. SG61-1L]|uniref:energy transducer TonB n=1 Tax=Erythrobacter sp. SG61-1L TaxID=1603897 RepID=UPI0006C934D9|nr:energy transducer TonB [Erythrobacter sp. SG61-1L]KPL68893.1 hypothetical protein SZ64_12780 [Erythrobacter sp. SG61-1L]